MSPAGHFRTLSAYLITHNLRRPRALVVAAWLWLAARTDDLDEKRRCLEAVLELEPDNEPDKPTPRATMPEPLCPEVRQID
jgi:hypothetical protein